MFEKHYFDKKVLNHTKLLCHEDKQSLNKAIRKKLKKRGVCDESTASKGLYIDEIVSAIS